MNPNYIYTITLYRKGQDGAWDKTVLRNCFWKSSIITTQNGTDASMANTYTVRIPKGRVKADFTVSVGDVVVLGECMDEITRKTPNTAAEVLLRNKPNAFKVTAFSDNTGHIMDKHFRLGG